MRSESAKIIVMPSDNEWNLDEKRIRAAIQELSFEGVRQFEIKMLGIRNKLGAYLKNKNAPAAPILARLCEVLGASPLYLYGRGPDACRRYLLKCVQHEFGPEEHRVLEIVSQLGPVAKGQALNLLEAILGNQAPRVLQPADADAMFSEPAADEEQQREAPTKKKRRAGKRQP